MTNFAKLFAHVISNQLTLDLSDQITVVFVDYEANRALPPLGCSIELSEPFAMALVMGIKHYPRASVELEPAHSLYLTVVLNTAPKMTTANQVSRVVSMKMWEPNNVFQAQMVRMGPMAIRKMMATIQKMYFISVSEVC